MALGGWRDERHVSDGERVDERRRRRDVTAWRGDVVAKW